mgnify:CR=1 FL=1
MSETRTKVDALKDLGEKVTGKTINTDENETIVGILDKIANDYEGGGSASQENIILTGDISWLTGGGTTFEDEEDIAKLEHYKELVLDYKFPRFRLHIGAWWLCKCSC